MLLFHFISSYYTDVLCVSKVSLLGGIEKELNFKELELTFLKTKGIGNDSGIDKKELEWNLELLKKELTPTLRHINFI